MKARYHLVECPLNFKNLSRETEGVAPILFYSFEIILHPSFANISKREIYIFQFSRWKFNFVHLDVTRYKSINFTNIRSTKRLEHLQVLIIDFLFYLLLQAKQRASVKWLLSKAYNNRVPENLREPYYVDNEVRNPDDFTTILL